MQEALMLRKWDLIICDFSLPRFNAPKALELLNKSGYDIPFIIVSGTIGEESAVNALKAGAHDFIIKGNFARLIPAIQRELKEAEIRRERRERERELEAIASVSSTLRTAKTLGEMLSHLLDQALALVEAKSGSIWLFDPINDLIEQFSNVMLAATVALGVQKILLSVGAYWVLPPLVAAVAALWIVFSVFGRTSPRWVMQLFVLLLMVRFAVPVAMLGTQALSDTFLKPEYERSQLAIEQMKGKSEAAGQTGAAAEEGFWDKLKGVVSDAGGMRERVAELRDAAGELAERVTMLIVVFLLETMAFPLAILWLFFVTAKTVLRPAAPGAPLRAS